MSSSAQRQRSHLEYKVGWISALADELAAAQLMLDETHPSPRRRPNDDNNYVLGSIAGHNVVLLCLPHKKCGKVQAAVASQQMLATFPSIRFCLMVGIGGGVPSPWDIRLGDVVVSVPTNQESGVVQYDFGKTAKDGKLHRQGSLNNPPLVLLNAVNFLLASHQKAHEPRFQTYLTQVIERTDVGVFSSCLPDASRDYLFSAAYEHADAARGCGFCDEQHRMQREPRRRPGPRVHYGLIASGDQVMKHALTRDRLAHEFQFKCFEMEAAGLMDNVPCLVVRGISDYSDSHKNDDWHQYAALAAAAYAKDLLGFTAVDHADDMASSADPDTGRGVAASVQQNLCIRELNAWIRGTEEIGIYDELSANLQRRHGDTCSWLFSDEGFQSWSKLTSNQNVLWYNAPIASGKSVLSTVVQQHFKEQNLATAYFGYSFKNRSQRKAVNGLRSLAIQLANHSGAAFPQKALELQAKEMLEPQAQFMRDAVAGEVLSTILQPLSLVYVIVDGLDECDDQDTAFRELSAVISKPRYGSVKWFFTSRPDARIRRFFAKMQATELSPTPSLISSDIRKYLAAGLFELQQELQSPVGQDEAFDEKQVDRWVDKCDGNFLYARLMYSYWQSITRIADLATFVDKFPGNLSSYYMSTLERLCTRTEKERTLATRTFMYLTHSGRSMTWRELRNAVAIDHQVREYRHDHIPSRATILQLCGSFLTSDKIHEAQDEDDAIVRFCHKTVHDFFLVESSRVNSQDSSDDGDQEVVKEIRGFFPSSDEASIEMGLDCIWFLSYKRYSTVSRMHKILLEDSKEDAFLKYAATSWFRHLMDTPPDRAPVKQVCRFLQTPNFWACVAVQGMVSPYLFGTYRTVVSERSGRRPKIVGFEMGIGSYLSHVYDGFGHPLPAWMDNSDSEAKLARAFYLFVADWHAVLTGSPNELKQCIPLSDTQSALFANLACSKTMDVFHFAGHVADTSMLAYLSMSTPYLDERRLHVEMMYECKDADTLRYRQVAAFSKRSMAKTTTKEVILSDKSRNIVHFGHGSDGPLDVWCLSNKPLQLTRFRNGSSQVFKAPSPWQSSRSCCSWQIGRRDVQTTARGKIVVLHLSRQTNTEEHDTSEIDLEDSDSDSDSHYSGSESQDESSGSESNDDDAQSESSAAFSSSSSEEDSDEDWQVDGASPTADGARHAFLDGVVLLSESRDPLWIPLKKGPWDRVAFKATVHPASGNVTWSAPGREPFLPDIEFGQWQMERFHDDEKQKDGETLYKELRWSACGRYLYCLRTSFHRDERLTCKVTLHTYHYRDDKGFDEVGAPQSISRSIAESLLAQLTDSALVYWSFEEVIMVLESFNSRRKLIKFPLRNREDDIAAATSHTGLILERPIFLPSGVTRNTKIFYQSGGGRPERPHKLFLYLERGPEGADPDRSVVDPVVIQWKIAPENAWRAWDQAVDGVLEGWDQERDVTSRLRGMYVDEGKKFPVPIRSGLDWTRKAFLSCY